MTPSQEHAYRYCPLCGSVLTAKLIKAGEPKRLVCGKCENVVYLDPKVAVGTIIRMEDDRIILVRRAIEPGFGKWVFPGGYVDRGEEITAAATREALEETNLNVRLVGLINIYSYTGRTPVIIVYAATVVSGVLRHCEESLEIGRFSRNEIPWHNLAFRSTQEALRDYFDGHLYRYGFDEK